MIIKMGSGEMIRTCIRCLLLIDADGNIDRSRYSEKYLTMYDKTPAEEKCSHKSTLVKRNGIQIAIAVSPENGQESAKP